MSDNLPESFDVSRFDTNGAEFKGDFALSKMPRLAELLVDKDGHCDVDLELSPRSRLGFELTGRVSATVKLICERCLDDMLYSIDANVALRLSQSDNEDTDVLIDEDCTLSLVSVVEDELILRVPTVPKHEDESECNPDMLRRATEHVPDETAEAADNPFAVLKQLKK